MSAYELSYHPIYQRNLHIRVGKRIRIISPDPRQYSHWHKGPMRAVFCLDFEKKYLIKYKRSAPRSGHGGLELWSVSCQSLHLLDTDKYTANIQYAFFISQSSAHQFSPYPACTISHGPFRRHHTYQHAHLLCDWQFRWSRRQKAR